MTSLREWLIAGDTRTNHHHVDPERADRSRVCFAPSTNRDIQRGSLTKRREQFQPDQLAQPAFEPVSIDRRLLMSWNHDRNPWKRERGSEDPHVEMRGPNSLPLANDGLDVGTPRQAIATRKSQAGVTRLRTCSGA